MIPHRRDIDGLRAVAVSSVIAYHVSEKYLPGGYIGVDIFFVLSGFLITSIIWSELAAGRFTIQRFYERRVRRIMPALLTMVAASSAAAICILLPSDLIGYGKSFSPRLRSLPTSTSGGTPIIFHRPLNRSHCFTFGPWASKSNSTCSSPCFSCSSRHSGVAVRWRR